MSTTEKAQEYDQESPIITYSNRIQKHMYDLTLQLGLNNKVDATEKRQLRLLIANLSPQGKKALEKITHKLADQQAISMEEFDRMYGEVSDWIYEYILRDAFKVKPRYTSEGKL